MDRDFLPFFALSAFSGLRREEIIRLDWSEVKLDRNLIDLPFANPSFATRVVQGPPRLINTRPLSKGLHYKRV
jgi:integrase